MGRTAHRSHVARYTPQIPTDKTDKTDRSLDSRTWGLVPAKPPRIRFPFRSQTVETQTGNQRSSTKIHAAAVLLFALFPRASGLQFSLDTFPVSYYTGLNGWHKGQECTIRRERTALSHNTCVHIACRCASESENSPMKTIRLKKNEERRVRKGHLWIYSNEVQSPLRDYEAGEVIDVTDFRGSFIGRGYINPHSLICVRLLSFHQEQIDGSFFRRRIEKAHEYRHRVAADRDAYRLIFSEGDFLPGLIIDRYGDHFVVQTTTAGMDSRLELVCEVLEDLLEPSAIVVRNDAAIRQREDLLLYKKVVRGEIDGPVSIVSTDLTFEVDLWEGQKTGLYLDQWHNYGRLKGLLSGGPVLDCFCYSGGWALHAAHWGAARVRGVDSSEKGIGWARRNAELNGVSEICQFEVGDAFDTLADLDRKGEHFDCVILDPPALVKSKSKMGEGLRGYREINRRALKILSPSGILVTCSCSHHVDRETFLSVIRGAAAEARRRVRLIECRTQAPDHPVLLSMPETEYLTCAFLEVL